MNDILIGLHSSRIIFRICFDGVWSRRTDGRATGIPLNSILNLTEEQIKNSRIELNTKTGTTSVPFIDLWFEQTEEDRRNGAPCVTSYWGWLGSNHNFFEGEWVFSFLRLGEGGDDWLFVSAAKVLAVPKEKQADVEVLTDYAPFFGRLVINLHKGGIPILATPSSSTPSWARQRSRRFFPSSTVGRGSTDMTTCTCPTRSSTGFSDVRLCPRTTTLSRA